MGRAILFDLDGVIRHWDTEVPRAIAIRLGLPVDAIFATAFQHHLLQQLITGQITHQEWTEAAECDLAERYGEAGREAVREWATDMGKVDRKMVELAGQLRRSIPVGLLSNASTRLEEDLTAHGLIDAFDVICNSARMGCAKPEEQIYRMAAERLGVQPEECLFVDDTVDNVEGAAAAGMTAHQFTGMEDLQAWLKECGLL